MKIATFNIQNLFHRDKNLVNTGVGECLSGWTEDLDRLIKKVNKKNRDLERIRELSFLLGFDKVDHSRYAVLRERNGKLFFQERHFSLGMQASDLTNWNGWVAMNNIPLDAVAIVNKARIVAEADADILLLQEVEDRASLVEFNKRLSSEFNVTPYEEFVIEGNDTSGLGMGILTKNGYRLDTIKSHMHDIDSSGNPLFDIDCPEYTIITPSGKEIVIVDVHLSKPEEDKRKEQSERVAGIYDGLLSEGKENIVVSGTLNDVYFSNSLAPLLRGTDLTDVSKCDTFHVDTDTGKSAIYHSMGAYRIGVNLQQGEYLLFSPNLYVRLVEGGLNRKGVWRDKRPNWYIYPSIKKRGHAASQHPLSWGTIQL